MNRSPEKTQVRHIGPTIGKLRIKGFQISLMTLEISGYFLVVFFNLGGSFKLGIIHHGEINYTSICACNSSYERYYGEL